MARSIPARLAGARLLAASLLIASLAGVASDALVAPRADVTPAAASSLQALAASTPSAASLSASTRSAASPDPTPSSSPASVSQAAKAGASTVPLVPIVAFWDDRYSISLDALRVGLGGGYPAPPSPGTAAVAVSIDDASALVATLNLGRLDALLMPPDAVRAYVAATPGAVGLIRADDVQLGVRAIAVDGISLFGATRTHDLAEWPLLVEEPGVASAFSAQSVWTVAAGGDVMLDRAVYARSILDGQGFDYAWEGGQAVIDSRSCCGWGDKPIASGHRIGPPGAVERLFRQADLSFVNLESPEPNDFEYHSDGFSFTGDPELLAGLADAGIDAVSMANNHLGDGGLHAVEDETATLDALGVAHAGAGANLNAARAPAWFTVDGLRIAFIAYCRIQPTSYWATSSSAGSFGFDTYQILNTIRTARLDGADYVIVMPHWGIEYSEELYDDDQAFASRMIAAGADLILGSHSHWFGPMQRVGADHLIFYSLGDLVFDWTHDERTQESAIVDLTFEGTRLVQVTLHPTFIIDGQPNLLDPAADGRTVLDQARAASAASLGW